MTKLDTLEERAKAFYNGCSRPQTHEELLQILADFHRSETERMVREIREQADAEGRNAKLEIAFLLRELAERIEGSCK